MRPCNQCGQTVENSVVICESCLQKNRNSGKSPVPEPVRTVTRTPDTDHDVRDFSFDALIWAFVITTIALGGLIGLATASWPGFWVGAMAGLLVGIFFIAMSRRF